MKTISLLLLCVVACYAAPAAESTTDKYPNGYPTKFDNIDLDGILSSKRLLDTYIKCLVKNEQCSPEGRTLRDVLPHALATYCSKCNEKQRNGSLKVMKTLEIEHPADWKTLLAKWDPTGKLFTEFKSKNKELYDKTSIARH